MQVHGYINFDVALGTVTTNTYALTTSFPGKYELLLDNGTMQSLQAVFNWDNGTLNLRVRQVTIPAKHRWHQASYRD